MKAIAKNTYLLLVFMAYVMRRAGTFSMEDKVKMIEFLAYMAQNPDAQEHHEYVRPLLDEIVPRLYLLVDTSGCKYQRV
jgi:hypothetical protein